MSIFRPKVSLPKCPLYGRLTRIFQLDPVQLRPRSELSPQKILSRRCWENLLSRVLLSSWSTATWAQFSWRVPLVSFSWFWIVEVSALELKSPYSKAPAQTWMGQRKLAVLADSVVYHQLHWKKSSQRPGTLRTLSFSFCLELFLSDFHIEIL